VECLPQTGKEDLLKPQVLKDSGGAGQDCDGNPDGNLDGVSVEAVIQHGVVTEDVRYRDVTDLGTYHNESRAILALICSTAHEVEFIIGQFAHAYTPWFYFQLLGCNSLLSGYGFPNGSRF